MVLIGLTGTLGAGKGTVVSYLVAQYGFHHATVSEFLAEEARRRGLNPDRIARQDVANDFRSRGPRALMEAVFARIPEGTERVVLEPQHTLGEVRFIQEKGGKVIALDADLETRYTRIQKRGGPKDQVTFAEFRNVQELELASDDPNKNNLAAAIGAADFHLTNNGTVRDLHAQVEVTLKYIIPHL